MAKHRYQIAWETLKNLWAAGSGDAAKANRGAAHFFPGSSSALKKAVPSLRDIPKNRIDLLGEYYENLFNKKHAQLVSDTARKLGMTDTDIKFEFTKFSQAADKGAHLQKLRATGNNKLADLLEKADNRFLTPQAAHQAAIDMSTQKANLGLGRFLANTDNAKSLGRWTRRGTYATGAGALLGGGSALLFGGDDDEESDAAKKAPEKEQAEDKDKKKNAEFSWKNAGIGAGIGGIGSALLAYALSEKKNAMRNALIYGSIGAGVGGGVGGLVSDTDDKKKEEKA